MSSKKKSKGKAKAKAKAAKKKEEAAAAALAEEASKAEKYATPPEGHFPMMIEDQQMKKEGYELKSGEGISDVIPYKLFDWEFVQQDLKLGIYSSFHFIDEIAKGTYPENEPILVIADPEYKFGQNWLVCVTVEARDRRLNEFQAEQRAAEAAEQARLQAIADKQAEEEALRNAVYVEKPIFAQPYESETSKETEEEVNLFTTMPTRPRIRVEVSRPRKEFGGKYTFADEDADQFGVKEFRQHKDPNFELEMREYDTGLQVGPVMSANKSVKTQTTRFRQVRKALQYEPITASEEKVDMLFDDAVFLNFLQQATLKCENALQQNETMDVFQEEMDLAIDDDTAFGQHAESEVEKFRSFTHLTYSKNKCLPAVDWHPHRKGIVCVSCTDNLTFDQRTNLDGQARKAYNLIWNFKDLIHPQIVLESPFECFHLRFNPSQPHIIAAGTITGQVVMWDISQREAELKKKNAISHKGVVDDNSQKAQQLPPVKHKELSAIDSSHRRPVSDLCWLPDNMEVNNKGVVSINPDNKTYQFVTVASDGQMLFWDLRHKPKVRKQRAFNRKKKTEIEEDTWMPIFQLQLTEENGIGEMGVCRLNLTQAGSAFHVATDMGSLSYANWATPGTGSFGGPIMPDASEGQRFVKWIANDHFRPCNSLQRSPFYKDVMLSVGDWNFNLWKEGMRECIFSSPMSSTYQTVGRWSPTRPAVVFIAKADGYIDVWDFTDMSHKPAQSIAVGLARITCMEFYTSPSVTSKSKVMLAVGDATGALHILQLSRNLTRPVANELAGMESYLEREAKHVQYVEQQSLKKSKRGDMGDDYMEMPVSSSKVAEPLTDAEERKAEAAYQSIEAKFRAEFGLTVEEEEESPIY